MFKVDTCGSRNEKELSEEQINKAIDYAVKLGMPRSDVFYSPSQNTMYGTVLDWLIIGTDLYPKETRDTENPNSNISWRGVLAHEIVGHRDALLAGRTHKDNVLEEVQASLRASLLAPDLTEEEREDLKKDALFRLSKAGLELDDYLDELFLGEV